MPMPVEIDVKLTLTEASVQHPATVLTPIGHKGQPELLLLRKRGKTPLPSHSCSYSVSHSTRSLIPIIRAELAMTGMEESSCRSAPVTGKRMPGMASPTAIASTLREKIRFCLIARMAWHERLRGLTEIT